MSQTCRFFPHQAGGRALSPRWRKQVNTGASPLVSTKSHIQLVIGDPRAHSSPVGKDEGHGALAEAHQIASLRLGLQQPLSFPARLDSSVGSDSCDLISVFQAFLTSPSSRLGGDEGSGILLSGSCSSNRH